MTTFWKNFGIVLTFTSILLFVYFIYIAFRSDYKGDKQYYSYYSLTKKSPTIDSKIVNMDILIENIQKCGLSGHDAIWYKTPSNSYDSNFMVF